MPPRRGEGTTIGQGRFLRLVCANGWEHVERVGCAGVVAIVAVTDDSRILLVEQFRPACGERVIELPAGLAGDVPGDEHEAMEQAARRELLEETGYEAAQWQFLVEGPISSGLTSEEVAFFLARGLHKTAAGGGVDAEDIRVHEVPIDEAEAWLFARRDEGLRVDPKVFAGLYFAKGATSKL